MSFLFYCKNNKLFYMKNETEENFLHLNSSTPQSPASWVLQPKLYFFHHIKQLLLIWCNMPTMMVYFFKQPFLRCMLRSRTQFWYPDDGIIKPATRKENPEYLKYSKCLTFLPKAFLYPLSALEKITVVNHFPLQHWNGIFNQGIDK